MDGEEENINSLHMTHQNMTQQNLTQHMNSRNIQGGSSYPSPIPPSAPPSSYGPLRSPAPAPPSQFEYRMMNHSVFGSHTPSASLAPAGHYPPRLEQRYYQQSTTNYQRYAQLQQQLQKTGYNWPDPQIHQLHRNPNQSMMQGSPGSQSETTNTTKQPNMVKVETTARTMDKTLIRNDSSDTSLVNQTATSTNYLLPIQSHIISTDLLHNDNAIVEPNPQPQKLSPSKLSNVNFSVKLASAEIQKDIDPKMTDSNLKSDVENVGEALDNNFSSNGANFEEIEKIEIEVDIGKDMLEIKMEKSPTPPAQRKEPSPRKESSPRKKPTPVEGVFPCDLEGCDYVGRTDFGLTNHKKKHVREDGYDCLDCGESFKKTQMLVAHSVQHHGGIKCPHCEKRFSVRNGYNQHIKVVHLKERFPCNVCGKDFGCKTGLTTHMNMHMGLKPYQCEMCDKTFPGMDNLYRHKRLHCKGQVEATCPVCGKTLPRKEYLEKHMKIHSVGKTKTFSNEEKVEAVALAK